MYSWTRIPREEKAMKKWLGLAVLAAAIAAFLNTVLRSGTGATGAQRPSAPSEGRELSVACRMCLRPLRRGSA